MMSKKRNTKKSTELHFMMVKRKSNYVAFCVELALVREGKDPLKLKNRIERVAEKYVENVVEHSLSDDLLNQTLPSEYMKVYEHCLKEIEKYMEGEKDISKSPAAQNWGISNLWENLPKQKNQNLALA